MKDKRRTRVWATLFFLGTLLAAGCRPPATDPTSTPPPTVTKSPATAPPRPAANMANPASVHCKKQGHKLEIRTDKKGNQYGVCVFADGTECDEWAYYRGQCSPGAPRATIAPTTTPVPPDPTPAAAVPCVPVTKDTLGFELAREYSHETYGFTLLVPPGWVVEEITEPPHHTLRGHAIVLWSAEEPTAVLQIAFRRQDEEQFIGRTGVGAGEIVEAGAACFVEQEMSKRALVFQDKDMTILYGPGPEIQRGEMAFTIYLDYRGGWEDQTALSKEIQAEADQIIASLHL